METNKVLTRDNEPTNELRESAIKIFKGIRLSYEKVYYLDFEVNENTHLINRNKKAKHYTKNQVNRNMRALRSAYLVAMGAAAPKEIINFRIKYRIAASTLSLILGFSKNTISNIENEGITSLPSGRLIKMCLNNKDIMSHYIKICDSLDNHIKEDLSNKLMQQGI